MIFTKSTTYTIEALIELSKYENPVDIKTISRNTNIPRPFLAKLFQSLSKKGIVFSFKGVNGGFVLAKKLNEIKILDILDKEIVFYCSKNKENCTRDKDTCYMQPFFAKLEKEISTILNSYTIDDIRK